MIAVPYIEGDRWKVFKTIFIVNIAALAIFSLAFVLTNVYASSETWKTLAATAFVFCGLLSTMVMVLEWKLGTPSEPFTPVPQAWKPFLGVIPFNKRVNVIYRDGTKRWNIQSDQVDWMKVHEFMEKDFFNQR